MPGPRRVYLLLGAAQGFSWGGWAVVAVSWWVVDLGLPPLQLVLLGTVLELALFVAEVPTGVVADVWSRKWAVVASWAVIGVAQFLGPVSDELVVLMIWQALWSVGFALQSGADTAWVTAETGAVDDGLVVRHALARSGALVAGVVVAIGASRWSVTGTMQLFGVLSVVLAIVLAGVMTERHPPEAEEADVGGAWRDFAATLVEGWRLVLRTPPLWIIVTAAVPVAMADELVDRLDLARMVELGVPDTDGRDAVLWFGLIWIAMTLLNMPLLVLAARRIGEIDRNHLVAWMTGLVAVAALGVATMAGPVLALAVIGWFARDVAREVFEPLSIAWANRHATDRVRATVLSFQSQATTVGEALGVVLGVLAQVAGLPWGFAAAAGLLFVGAVRLAGLATTRPSEANRVGGL